MQTPRLMKQDTNGKPRIFESMVGDVLPVFASHAENSTFCTKYLRCLLEEVYAVLL